MGDRKTLAQTLINIMGEGHVYFQPPESIKLSYPCVIYKLQRLESNYADDIKYGNHKKYSLVFISRNAEDPLLDSIYYLPFCSHQDRYISANLYHDAFILYY